MSVQVSPESSQPGVISFSVRTEDGRLEYNRASLNALSAKRRNILRPPFYRIIRNIKPDARCDVIGF